MNQHSFQAISAMINGFPQSAAEKKALLLTYEKGLGGVPDRVIAETAAMFIGNHVPGQSPTFAPSVAEFVTAARRVPTDTLPKLPKPEPELRLSHAERLRMRLKYPMFNHASRTQRMGQLDDANKAGCTAMIALADEWGVPVPEELRAIPPIEADRQWLEARNRAWAEINRNPPPFLRRRRAAA